MTYQERLPCSGLRPFINCYWMITSQQGATLRDRTFPDGCQEIVFHIDSLVKRRDQGKADFYTNPTAELVGQMTKPYDIVTSGAQIYVGVKFLPQGLSAFHQESTFHFRDQSIAINHLFPTSFNKVVDAILSKPSLDDFSTLMDSFFVTRLARGLHKRKSYEYTAQAVQLMLEYKNDLALERMHHQLGIGPRYLQDIFKHHVGLSPKQLFSMIRFQKAFQYLARPSMPLTEVAQRCGYYDQAHFTREFSRFTNLSPSAYRAHKSPLTGFFLQPDSTAYLCNYKN